MNSSLASLLDHARLHKQHPIRLILYQKNHHHHVQNPSFAAKSSCESEFSLHATNPKAAKQPPNAQNGSNKADEPEQDDDHDTSTEGMFQNIANEGSLMPRSSVQGEMEKLFCDTIMFYDKNDWSGTQQNSKNPQSLQPKTDDINKMRDGTSPPPRSLIASPRSLQSPRSCASPLTRSYGAADTLRTEASMRSPAKYLTSMPSWKTMYAGKSQYGLDIEKKTTLIQEDDANIDLNAPLPKPYDGGCLSISALRFYLQSCLAKNPRIYALYLFIVTIASRCLIMFDMFTDFLVTYELYRAGEQWWFMLSALFIAFPFVLVWNASLRWLQYQVENSEFIENRKHNPVARWIINFALVLYMFPPFGATLVVVAEIYWVLTDIVSGMKALIYGYGIIDKADRKKGALKTYRRAIEIFAESIPQTLLQAYIFLMARFGPNTNMAIASVPVEELYMSIGSSVLNLSVHFCQFYQDSKLHGMLFGEYALSVLQLAEVPIAKFVPRLPAIKQGKVDKVNFCGFQFDKASVTPLLEAINSPRCRLQTIKLSVGSLSNLELNTCKMLGHWLKQKELKVLISRVSNLYEVKNLFKSFDDDGNGFLDEQEFLAAIKQFKCPLALRHIKKQRRVFQEMAIRRQKKRDRIYFYDLFLKTADLKSMDDDEVDLTQIEFPIHFIFKNLKYTVDKLLDTGHFSPKHMEKRLMADMSQLFYFCQGLGLQTQRDDVGNNVLFAVIEASYAMDALPREHRECAKNYEKLLWIFFLKLLETPISMFTGDFYWERNLVFAMRDRIDGPLNDEESDKLLRVNDFIHDLDVKESRTGYSCFEYCFLYKEPKMAKCRHFVYILDTFLQTIRREMSGCHSKQVSNFLSELLDAPLPPDVREQAKDPRKHLGEFYRLFKGTNGFHVKDAHGFTPLYYAVKYGKLHAVWFFIKHVVGRKHLEESDAHRLDPNPRARNFTMKRRSMFNRTQRPSKVAFTVPSSNPSLSVPPLSMTEESSLRSEDCISMPWLKDQNYLHSILHAALATKAENPTTHLLHCLLSSDKFDTNHCLKRREIATGIAMTIVTGARRSILDPPEPYLGHQILKLRSRINRENHNNVQGQYLLQCLVALKHYGYSMMNAPESTGNTILHRAALNGDVEVFEHLVEVYEQQKWTLSMDNIGSEQAPNESMENESRNGMKSGINAKGEFLRTVDDVEQEMTALFNAKNNAGKTALDIAMEDERIDIAEILLDTDEQQIDVSRMEKEDDSIDVIAHFNTMFGDERECGDSEMDEDQRWLRSFIQLINDSDGELLSRFDEKTKLFLLKHFLEIVEVMEGGSDSTKDMTDKIVHGNAGVVSPCAVRGLTERQNPILFHNVERIVQFLQRDLGISQMVSQWDIERRETERRETHQEQHQLAEISD